MKERAMALCMEGENCSRAILRAASETFGFPLSEELLMSCNAISAGFGVGGICSALVAGVMVLGILFPIEEAKQKSLILLCRAQGNWNCVDCCRLSARRENCNDLIGEIAQMLEEIIREA
ncbi:MULTISPECIES: C-GCAxxG-C-C family protein [Anaerotignum]|uniref:C-GCAxxG-C-C family protein n=1 Tax=Anaerotignum TaxID=2039240 RepID=UPI00210BBA4D|nr:MULTISPECIES: C-GCAxxG-C-C family protein [Anaerotignum]MCQ4936817.1 C-GCAxxG-C-C family protein [Anaerotignum propionicum]